MQDSLEKPIVFDFYKTKHEEWFVDLPDYPGPVEDLQMVLGADDLLDNLSHFTNSVSVLVSTEEIPLALKLTRNESVECTSGAWYKSSSLDLWLCDVMLFLYGEFPKELYLEKTK